MSDLIERVAKAIYEAQMADGASPRPYDRLVYRRVAKAAIEAMSETPAEGAESYLGNSSDLGGDLTINWNK